MTRFRRKYISVPQ